MSVGNRQDLLLLGLQLNISSPNGSKLFPAEDIEDISKGAHYIPGEVTDARRRGENVRFDPKKMHWIMPNGSIVK